MMIVKTVQTVKQSLMDKWLNKLFNKHPARIQRIDDIFDRSLYEESLVVIEKDGSRLEHLSGFTPRDMNQRPKNHKPKTTIEFR